MHRRDSPGCSINLEALGCSALNANTDDEFSACCRQLRFFPMVLCAVFHTFVTIVVFSCEAQGSEHWTTRDILQHLKVLPPKQLLVPTCILPEDVEDAIDAEECHDMKCPITFAVLVQPVEFAGKVCSSLTCIPQTMLQDRRGNWQMTARLKHSGAYCMDVILHGTSNTRLQVLCSSSSGLSLLDCMLVHKRFRRQLCTTQMPFAHSMS